MDSGRECPLLTSLNLNLISRDLTVMSRNIAVISRNITVISRNITVISRNITAISRNITVISRNLTVISRNITAISRNITAISRNLTVISRNITVISSDVTVRSSVPTDVAPDRFDPWDSNSAMTLDREFVNCTCHHAPGNSRRTGLDMEGRRRHEGVTSANSSVWEGQRQHDRSRKRSSQNNLLETVDVTPRMAPREPPVSGFVQRDVVEALRVNTFERGD